MTGSPEVWGSGGQAVVGPSYQWYAGASANNLVTLDARHSDTCIIASSITTTPSCDSLLRKLYVLASKLPVHRHSLSRGCDRA